MSKKGVLKTLDNVEKQRKQKCVKKKKKARWLGKSWYKSVQLRGKWNE